ncbi:MAG: hypothetical protein AVDCRST_MAG20-234, partial [uncultured Acidimicrobiales bacterium]
DRRRRDAGARRVADGGGQRRCGSRLRSRADRARRRRRLDRRHRRPGGGGGRSRPAPPGVGGLQGQGDGRRRGRQRRRRHPLRRRRLHGAHRGPPRRRLRAVPGRPLGDVDRCVRLRRAAQLARAALPAAVRGAHPAPVGVRVDPPGPPRRLHHRGPPQRGPLRGAAPDERAHDARRLPPHQAGQARSGRGPPPDVVDVPRPALAPAAGRRRALADVLVLPPPDDDRGGGAGHV